MMNVFRKAIQNDLSQNNIKITDVCHGLINTGLTTENAAKTVKFVFDLPHEITISSIEVRNIKNY